MGKKHLVSYIIQNALLHLAFSINIFVKGVKIIQTPEIFIRYHFSTLYPFDKHQSAIFSYS